MSKQPSSDLLTGRNKTSHLPSCLLCRAAAPHALQVSSPTLLGGTAILQTAHAHPFYNELQLILITWKAHQPVISSPVNL